MADIERAIKIAVDAHMGQKDKVGAPYILHPLRVMADVEGEAEKIVAILHVVVEDSVFFCCFEVLGQTMCKVCRRKEHEVAVSQNWRVHTFVV